MDIIPLLKGVHKEAVDEDGVSYLPEHTGAVTLIRTSTHNVLVDVGARGFDDIDKIILTHLHLDHSFNVNLFRNAEVYAWRHRWDPRMTIRLGSIDGYKILEGVSVFLTPGHTVEHISVLVNYGVRNVVIAGDAINGEYVRTGEVSAFSYDRDLYVESAEKIISMADVIIPGHGDIIDFSKNLTIE